MSPTELNNKVETVGLVGIGTMGKCMLERLMANGFKVAAYDAFSEAQEYAKKK